MDSTSVVWIVVAVAAVIVIAALVFAALNARKKRRHVEAERIREDVSMHTAKVEKRQALADETAARARAAEAEAEAKAAEAARLKERAGEHHEEIAASREEIDERSRHADKLDPNTRVHDDPAQQEAAQPETGAHRADRR